MSFILFVTHLCTTKYNKFSQYPCSAYHSTRMQTQYFSKRIQANEAKKNCFFIYIFFIIKIKKCVSASAIHNACIEKLLATLCVFPLVRTPVFECFLIGVTIIFECMRRVCNIHSYTQYTTHRKRLLSLSNHKRVFFLCCCLSHTMRNSSEFSKKTDKTINAT